MKVSHVLLLLLAAIAAEVGVAEEDVELIEKYGNGGIKPRDTLQIADLLRGKKCRTKKPCGKAGGECVKKNTCDGEVLKVKKACSGKGCECCLPKATTPEPTTPEPNTPEPTTPEPTTAGPNPTTDGGNFFEDYFTCENGGEIPGWWKCDGYDDCSDGSDEKSCNSCTQGQHKCPTGECIRDAWKCDGYKDCADESDEKNCALRPVIGASGKASRESCSGFQCKNTRCIISSWKCDGFDDCGDNSDESDCKKCSDDSFTCKKDNKCIKSAKKCDGQKDCSDGSDEEDCKDVKCKSDQFQCVDKSKCISSTWKCDQYKDCKDGSDEKDCQKCTSSQFECKNKKCVSSSAKCNGKDDCGDKSDEENCPNTCKCGIPNIARIVGGTEVNPKRKYPWQVGLKRPGYYNNCGGSIINDRWILTAAHCIVDDKTGRLKYDSSSDIRVNVGEHHQFQTSDDDSNTKKYQVKTWIKHPQYNSKTVDYDFALLELTEAIPFNNVIRPVCLPSDDSKTYVGQTATVSGWGLQSTKGSLSPFLQEVQVPILANDKCGSFKTKPAIKLCAGGQAGKDSCGGDSGGPLTVLENGKYVQVGVVSYGHPSGCASASYPGVYARTSKILSWIKTTATGGKTCN